MKLKKDAVRILEPIAVFAIIAGIGINIVVPLIAAFLKIGSETKNTTIKAIWLFAVLCGFVYSLIVLKYLTRSGVLDCLLYFVMAIIFIILAGGAVCFP